ncbi:SPOR domain-containing protein [Brevundimonas sp.]|uniref:SPOR domain-containing protein n=1 Tax=Brevundimonas sp. TaxID=1871086 RepID=UPI002FC8D511
MSVAAVSILVTACDTASDTPPSAYQAWADKVATIPLTPASDAGTSSDAPRVTLPLDPQKPDTDDKPSTGVKVELVSPHQLWDLRDGPVKLPSIEISEGPPVSAAANKPAASPAARPTASVAPNTTDARTIQLGAFSTQQQAQNAWDRLSSGSNKATLAGLSPRFDPVQVNGRILIRLRVSASAQQAQSLCRSIAAADPWCQSPAT